MAQCTPTLRLFVLTLLVSPRTDSSLILYMRSFISSTENRLPRITWEIITNSNRGPLGYNGGPIDYNGGPIGYNGGPIG